MLVGQAPIHFLQDGWGWVEEEELVEFLKHLNDEVHSLEVGTQPSTVVCKISRNMYTHCIRYMFLHVLRLLVYMLHWRHLLTKISAWELGLNI